MVGTLSHWRAFCSFIKKLAPLGSGSRFPLKRDFARHSGVPEDNDNGVLRRVEMDTFRSVPTGRQTMAKVWSQKDRQAQPARRGRVKKSPHYFLREQSPR
jgi:hypothetical protein